MIIIERVKYTAVDDFDTRSATYASLPGSFGASAIFAPVQLRSRLRSASAPFLFTGALTESAKSGPIWSIIVGKF